MPTLRSSTISISIERPWHTVRVRQRELAPSRIAAGVAEHPVVTVALKAVAQPGGPVRHVDLQTLKAILEGRAGR